MVCQNCGSPIPDDALFCEECGAKVEAASQPKSPPSNQHTAPPAPDGAPRRQEKSGGGRKPQRSKGPKPTLLIAAVLAAAVVAVAVVKLGTTEQPPEPAPQAAAEAQPATAENEPPAETETPPASGVSEGEEAFDYSAYSTTERPTLADFQWFADGVAWNGVPEGVRRLTDFAAITGDWKAFLYYDKENTRDSTVMEWMNVNLSGSPESAKLVLDWYYIYINSEGEGYNEEDMTDSTFVGTFRDGTLNVTGAGNIHLTDFYAENGREYAVGTMDTPDGVPADVALVRP